MIIKNKKKIFSFFLALFIGGGVFFLIPSAHAAVSDWAGEIIGGLVGWIISALGLILVLVMKALVLIAQYNDFIGSPAVSNGWRIVRDICNMFFVLILLIIAFATILKIENYNYKKWLPKLILMAILINFSKTICGLLIDFAQVVMLTFVNAFKDVAAGNLITNLGITDILTLAQTSDEIGFWAIVGSYVLGLIYILIALVVITTMLAMLVMRIVMIWIYVVLSPAAYLMSAFPGGQKYSSQWWTEFTKNLIVGPVLAFFIWLSFVSLQIQDVNKDFKIVDSTTESVAAEAGIYSNGSDTTGTKASTPGVFIKFIIAIGMLIGGLKISQEIGGAAGGMAGKGMTRIQKGAQIGMGGVAAITGARYASSVLKNYNSQRKARREEGYRVGAERLAGGIGNAKRTAVAPVNKSVDWIRKNTVGRDGVRAEEAAKVAKMTREKSEILNTNYRRKEGVVGNYEYDKQTKKWRNKDTGVMISHESMGKEVEQETKKYSDAAISKENESKMYRQKQNKTDKYIKYGMTGAGVIATVASGGLTGLGGAALAAGVGFGAPKLGESIKHAGEKDLSIASNWRLRQITETKDKMKNNSNEDVVAAMDDSSKSAFARAAASLEAMDRGLLSLNDAKNKKEEIKEALGGKDAKGGWRDKKVGSYVENTLEKKYVGATKIFENLDDPDLNSADPAKKAAAEKRKSDSERTIKSRYEQGVYSLELDTGTLEKSINFLSNTMRNSEFTRQFKSLKDQTKKDSIIKSLKMDGSQGAKEKLSFVKDLKYAFGDDQAGKEEALGNFSMEDLSDVFRKGTADQQNAIKEVVQNTRKVNKIDLFTNAKNELDGDAPAVKDMRRKLGLVDFEATQS